MYLVNASALRPAKTEAATTAPTAAPTSTWASVWSPSRTLDQPTSAISGAVSSSTGPRTSARMAHEPAATAEWTDIFHQWFTAAATRSPTPPAATPASSERGACNATSRTAPTTTDPNATRSGTRRCDRSPT